MPLLRFAAASLLALSASAAMAAPVTVYSGNAAPDAEGWSQGAGGTASVVTGAGTTQFITVNNPNPRTSQYNAYSLATGATDYIVSIRLQLNSAGYNNLDAGLAFSAFGATSGFIRADRVNTLMLANGQVIWGDLGASAAVNNSTGFHDYSIRYLNGILDVYFDAAFADIESGIATSILTRANPVPFQNAVVGTIVFGDNTNDPDVNSDYVVDYVNFRDLNAVEDVPEPAMLGLFGLGALGLGLARRRKV